MLTYALLALKKCLRTFIHLSMLGLARGPHITRYEMYRRLRQYRRNQTQDIKVLSISGSKPLCWLLGFEDSQITEVNYPEYNLLALNFSDNAFDYVISDQVLEHVEGDPQLAIDESFRVLKPGGWAIHTTCFVNPLHAAPSDFWRFSPDALRLLCRKFSKIIEVDGWGNPYLWIWIWLGLRSEGIPETSWHPINRLAQYNDFRWMIVTWVIAQK